MANESENSPPVLVENDQTEADLNLGAVSDSDKSLTRENGTENSDLGNGTAAEGTEYELSMKEEDLKKESGEPEGLVNEMCKSPEDSQTSQLDEPPPIQTEGGEVEEGATESTNKLEPESEQVENYLETEGESKVETMEAEESADNICVEQSLVGTEDTLPLPSADTCSNSIDGKEGSSADLEVQMASTELDAQSEVVKTGSSPTLSLAEEDQSESSTEVSYKVDSETIPEASKDDSQNEESVVDKAESVTETLHGDNVCGLQGPGEVNGQEVQPPEPDDPECDLASSDTFQVTAPEIAIVPATSDVGGVSPTPSTTSNGSTSMGKAKPTSGTSHVKEALGLMLKQGMRSATKDTSQIREALGHFQQGLKSAITETTQFLDGGGPGARARGPHPPPHHPPQPDHTPQPHHTPQPQSSVRTPLPAVSVSVAAPQVERTLTESAELSVNKEKCGDGAGDASVLSDVPEDELLSQLDAELETEQTLQKPAPQVNGVRKFDLNEIPEFKELKLRSEELQKELNQQKDVCTRLRSVNEAQDNALVQAQEEADQCKKQLEEFNSKSTEEVYMAQIRALELTIAGQQKDLSSWKDRLELHDKAAKDAVGKLHNELKNRVDQLTAVADSCRREKEDMVLKYAKAESKNIEMENKMAKNDGKMKDMVKERESMINKFKTLKADQVRCRELFESRSTEVLHLRRELERCKELLVSQEGKTKWAHNKLKSEMDLHKETKAKLEELQKKHKATREEADQIRRDCQSKIKSYQESEEIKSNSLDIELKQKETELILHRQDKIDQEEMHHMVRRELETLKMKHKEMLEELTTWRDKVKCLDGERIVQEHNLNGYRETLQKQKETNSELEKRLHDLIDIENTVIEVRKEISQIRTRNEEVELECTELRSDMDKCATREQEHLEFAQKISDKNAHLQSENSALQNKVKGFTAEVERLTDLSDGLQTKKQELEKELSLLKAEKEKTESDMSAQLLEKTKEVKRLTTEVDDMKNEIKTLKRKHAANTKDLMRQLQNCRRRLESLEPKELASSMGSRTSSNGSLDTVNNGNHHHRLGSVSSQQTEPEPEPFVQVVEVDKQMLIEKIVRLQKAHARKNEKLEFLEDHIQQLFAEVQKKNKIIQNYALREESGTMAPEATDLNKALLAKKGGIMSSLYNAQQQDGAMTLELSLDISRKLQAVLEDTLLKNITLKENLDTLGEEIARLSQENRQIKLKEGPPAV